MKKTVEITELTVYRLHVEVNTDDENEAVEKANQAFLDAPDVYKFFDRVEQRHFDVRPFTDDDPAENHIPTPLGTPPPSGQAG